MLTKPTIVDLLLNLNGEGETITFQVWDADTARTDDLLGSLDVPVTSIASTKKTDKEQRSGTTADLKNTAGEVTGALTYSMRYSCHSQQVKPTY